MQGETGELWLELCAKATTEQDPQKLLKLIAEINCLLLEKERRLQERANKQRAAS
jgi:hypothetical protein